MKIKSPRGLSAARDGFSKLPFAFLEHHLKRGGDRARCEEHNKTRHMFAARKSAYDLLPPSTANRGRSTGSTQSPRIPWTPSGNIEGIGLVSGVEQCWLRTTWGRCALCEVPRKQFPWQTYRRADISRGQKISGSHEVFILCWPRGSCSDLSTST